MNRCFISRINECKGMCEYCFGKRRDYKKFMEPYVIEDNTILYPNCDGDFFDYNYEEMLEYIKQLTTKNLIVSISTKFDISNEKLKKCMDLNNYLKTHNDGFLKISVSFSCENHLPEIEKNTSTYVQRLELIKRIIEHNIPYINIIKPILPFIDFSEYKKIIDDTIIYCPYYILGDLYFEQNSAFYNKYLKESNNIISEKKPSWNGNNGAWLEVSNKELKNKIMTYIDKKEGKVFDSDENALIYMKNKGE